MKKTYIILTLFIAALFATSCETNYDEFDTDRGDTIGFTFGTLELGMNAGQSFDLPVTYFVTSASSEERTFQVVVNAEESDMTSDNYSFDSAVIIPANERSGTLFITVTNNSLPDEFVTAVFEFESSDSVTSGKKAIIRLKNNS